MCGLGSSSAFGVLGLLGEREGGGYLDVGDSPPPTSWPPIPVIRVRVRCLNAYVCLLVCGVGGGLVLGVLFLFGCV